MAAKKVLDLLVDIETKGIKTLDKASDSFKKLDKSTNSTTKRIQAFAAASNQMASRIAPAVAGLSAITAGFAIAAKKTFAAADTIAKTADKIGLSTTALQELRVAAGLSGVESNVLDMAMQRFSRRVAEAAKGTGVLAKVFKEYNIQAKDSTGKTRALEDVLNDYADVIQKAPNAQERLRLAFSAFDSEGAKLANTLKDGSAGLKKGRLEAQKYGLVLEEDLLRGAEKTNDAFDLLTQAVSVRFQRAILTLGPQIQQIVAQMTEWLPTIQMVLTAITPYLPVIVTLVGGLSALGATFLFVINPVIAFGATFLSIIGPLTAFGAAVVGVVGGIPLLIGAIVALAVAAGALFLKFERPEVFDSLVNWVSSAMDRIKSAVASTVAYIKAAFASTPAAPSTESTDITSKEQLIGKKFRTGGSLPGYGGGDRVKALLEAGEFVVRKEAVRKYGTGFLNSVNNMQVPSGRMKFQDGGAVPSSKQTNTFNFSAPITANGAGMEDVFRRTIIPELNKAIRNNTDSIATLIKKLR